MGMPRLLVLVRHGKSEGNVVKKRSQKGNNEAFHNKDFLARHTSHFRLVDRGREQAKLSGEWIRQNLGYYFDRYYTSGYVRAMETAAHLGLRDAVWYTDFHLRERDWGDMDAVSEEDRHKKFAQNMERKSVNPFYWHPPSGESIAQVCLRVDRMIDTLHRECDGKRVIIVSHGELMWAWRVRLERMTPERYLELDASKDPRDHIDNGHVLIYTRENPETGKLAPYLAWMKSVSPSHPEASREEWQPIIRPRFTNAELLRIIGEIQQLIY